MKTRRNLPKLVLSLLLIIPLLSVGIGSAFAQGDEQTTVRLA